MDTNRRRERRPGGRARHRGRRTRRVRGRAVFDHVTWTLGDTEVECDLDDMQAYIPDTGMNPADKPECHHIFTQLGDIDLSATATYRIEQDIAIRNSGYPWPAEN